MPPFAFLRVPASVYADLPPTLQPFAILAAAPPSDRVRAAGLSGLIYFALIGSLVAASAWAPKVALVPIPVTQRERVYEAESNPRLTVLLPPVAAQAGQGGQSEAPVLPQVSVPAADPVTASANLPTVDHHGDAVAAGASSNLAPSIPLRPGALGIAGAAMIHDFSSMGLEVLQKVDPTYPELARRARIQGNVVLLMTVDQAGLPTQVQVLEGPLALQDSAVHAARQWRFVPARMDGQTVKASFRLTLKFSLR